MYFGRHVLQQHHFPPSLCPPLFDASLLARASILELGCGTGLLAILLSPLCKSYTASDLMINLRLCSRNLKLNSIDVTAEPGCGVSMEEIDWFDTSRDSRTDSGFSMNYDLILAVDCVFNEALALPLISTLNRYCSLGSRTVALVIVELRSSDVVSDSPDLANPLNRC